MPRRMRISYGDVSLAGRVYSPSGRERDVLPAVVISHEFGLNMLSTARYARRIVDLGYHVVLFDFAGSGSGRSRGRTSVDMSVLTEKDDLNAVLDAVRARPEVGADHVILGGCSQGGLVSSLVAAERPGDVAKLFLLYPALSIPDDARRGTILGVRIDPTDPPASFRALYVRLGRRYVRDAQSLEPWREMTPYAGPVLLCHGTADRTVDSRYSADAASRYAQAELHLIPGARHMFLRAGFAEAIGHLRRFLAV